MDNKNKYYLALAENNGSLNEMELGELLGLEDEVTRQIIAQLMSEHKIEYDENGFCNYRFLRGLRAKKTPREKLRRA